MIQCVAIGQRLLACSATISAAALLAACGTPAPQDYAGQWLPVNRFQDAPAEIPLNAPYVFYATPMDETLKTMLGRWAKDAGFQLSYRLGSDFTLFKPVARIRTADIQAAASDLSVIYSAQGVRVSADSRQILVQPVPVAETRTNPPPDAHPAAQPAHAG